MAKPEGAKQLRIIIVGEVNTGKTTVGNLFVKAFREMGFLAEFAGEQLWDEQEVEKRIGLLLGKVERVVIEEVQANREPEGATEGGTQLGESPLAPLPVEPRIAEVLQDYQQRYAALEEENLKLKAVLSELNRAVAEGKIIAGSK